MSVLAEHSEVPLPELGVGITYSSAIEPVLEQHPDLFDVVEFEPQTTWIETRDRPGLYRVSDDVLEHIAQLPILAPFRKRTRMAQQHAASAYGVPSQDTLALLASVRTRPLHAFGPDRRNETSRQRLLGRVRGEFLEMRGLKLTSAQARRLFNLREDICTRVLDTLVSDGVLRQRADGTFGLMDLP